MRRLEAHKKAEPSQLVEFNLDEHRYALHLSVVERVLPTVEVTPLPKAPDIVSGVVDVGGRIIPVVNIRRRFHLRECEIDPSHRLILAHTSRRAVALVADAVGGVVHRPEEEVITAQEILPRMEYVEGVAKLEGGLILIHDLDKFLSLDEENNLDAALKGDK